MQGYVQVYTGDGKGKTTAALGLVMRAAGAGLRIGIVQFLKERSCSEIDALANRFPEVTVERFGRGEFVRGRPSPEDVQAARGGFLRLREMVAAGAFDLIVADEINVAVSLQLVSVPEMLALIEDKPSGLELVLTGRGADPAVIQQADLVTEMRCVKHYHDSGVRARKGIED